MHSSGLLECNLYASITDLHRGEIRMQLSSDCCLHQVPKGRHLVVMAMITLITSQTPEKLTFCIINFQAPADVVFDAYELKCMERGCLINSIVSSPLSLY